MDLRPISQSDAADMLAIRGDPETMRYEASAPWNRIEQAEQWIARDIAAMSASDHLRLGLAPFGEGGIIGSCTLFRFDNGGWRAEIGYELRREHWGKGYMREALRALLDYGFAALRLSRVEADVHPGNLASARTLEKLGFSREGLLRERWKVGGEISDSVIYGLLAREWRAR